MRGGVRRVVVGVCGVGLWGGGGVVSGAGRGRLVPAAVTEGQEERGKAGECQAVPETCCPTHSMPECVPVLLLLLLLCVAAQALESFVGGSAGDVRPFMEQLLTEALSYIRCAAQHGTQHDALHAALQRVAPSNVHVYALHVSLPLCNLTKPALLKPVCSSLSPAACLSIPPHRPSPPPPPPHTKLPIPPGMTPTMQTTWTRTAVGRRAVEGVAVRMRRQRVRRSTVMMMT